jgi:hypothetical protein
LTVRLSEGMAAALSAQAELDAPGAPNLAATLVRLAALGMREAGFRRALAAAGPPPDVEPTPLPSTRDPPRLHVEPGTDPRIVEQLRKPRPPPDSRPAWANPWAPPRPPGVSHDDYWADHT